MGKSEQLANTGRERWSTKRQQAPQEWDPAALSIGSKTPRKDLWGTFTVEPSNLLRKP